MASYANGVAMLSAENAADDAADCGLVFGRCSWGFCRGREFTEHLARGIFSISDPGHQIVLLAESVIGGDALELFFFNVLERNAVFARFFLNQLAANFNGALALMDVEPMLNFVTRA